MIAKSSRVSRFIGFVFLSMSVASFLTGVVFFIAWAAGLLAPEVFLFSLLFVIVLIGLVVADR